MYNPSQMVAAQSVQDNKKRAAAARTAHNDRQAKRICKAACYTLLQRLPSAMISGTMSPSQWAGTPLADSSTSSDIRPWTPLNTQVIQFLQQGQSPKLAGAMQGANASYGPIEQLQAQGNAGCTGKCSFAFKQQCPALS